MSLKIFLKEYLFSFIRVLGECEEYKDLKARLVLFIGTKQTFNEEKEKSTH